MDPRSPYNPSCRIVHFNNHIMYSPKRIVMMLLLICLNLYVLLAIANIVPECRANLLWHLMNPTFPFGL